MNPTDQARKEARRRELKKNKKQRQLVRTAVLKGKNPRDIIFELEKVDDMEFNIVSPSPLNQKVLGEKRRKLTETWNRVMRMYEADDNPSYMEFKKLWNSYLTRKNDIVQAFEAVKSAENVQLDDIPLPSFGPGHSDDEEGGLAPGIPLPPSLAKQPKSSILKKPPSVLESLKPKTCPGVPAGPPPLLVDYIDDGSDDENEGGEGGQSAGNKARRKKIRFEGADEDEEEGDDEDDDTAPPGDESIFASSADKDVDAYMKELEAVHRQAEKDRMAARSLGVTDVISSGAQPLPPGLGPPAGMPPGPPPGPRPAGMHPPGLMYRPAPPPLRPGVAPPGVRLPPGPPPGRPPTGLPPGVSGGGRLPPGPPPGVPPRINRLPPPVRPQSVVSAGPQLFTQPAAGESASAGASATKEKSQGAVIKAKPQMRNLMSDVTRFVPTHVRRKEDAGHVGQVKGGRGGVKANQQQNVIAAFAPGSQRQGKDDAYAEFMKEMEQMNAF